jgi:ferredoxin
MKNITSVWVEDGCICCQACVAALPSVFCFPNDRAEILGSVREDGKTSYNDAERSLLNDEGILLSDQIIEAAVGCPVEVIKYAVM